MTLGVVVVSHSKSIATGIKQLAGEVAKDVPFTIAGGSEDDGIGTSFNKVLAAVEENEADTVLTFFDLGSARMNLDMAMEFTDKEMAIYTVPVVEGAYTAAALIQAGASLEAINEQLTSLIIEK
ncbi:dihydroxyacetone kinase DhaM subunit [Granulicatella balaenopterae]|uniref:phosphoenolpyruvate--glycerone phosphotransferase n=1 Tax=Granulicatella balaenopterae TaxID=137733 RepID=A0A1H9N4N2_9LACT|nr:dihydroxyacetone kinase DhaM subunit [Granulicatella balaenopterae]